VQITLSDAGGMLTIAAPLQISLQSAVISMAADIITLTTTGSPTASTVVIDTIPFGNRTPIHARARWCCARPALLSTTICHSRQRRMSASTPALSC
jgi:hypothetical protein